MWQDHHRHQSRCCSCLRGVRTLVVDMDPQGIVQLARPTRWNRVRCRRGDAGSTTRCRCLQQTLAVGRNPRCCHTIMLALQDSSEGELSRLADRDQRFHMAESLSHGHDLCLIDCPPSIGLTFNALERLRRRSSRSRRLPAMQVSSAEADHRGVGAQVEQASALPHASDLL